MFGLSLIKKYIKILVTINCLCISFCLVPVLYAQGDNPHGPGFDIECENCHNTDTWQVNLNKVNFDHAETGFQLNGQHSTALCSDCHTSLKFDEVANNCVSCHVDAHKNTLGLECAKCHNTSSWKQVNMQQIHNQFRFPLTGVHSNDNCELCHTNSNNFIFSGASINCVDCHRNDFNTAKNPLHTFMGLSVNCEECHTLRSTNWSAERFKHEALSFEGVHVNLECNQCHNAIHPGFTQECFGCHKIDFENTSDPSHVSENFPHECLTCHNTTSWAGAQINHDQTSFPLTGSHRNVDCKSCHTTGYSGTSALCFSCHENTFNNAPQHFSLSYPHTCEMCHNTTVWNQTNFNHDATAFQLTGSHINVDCNSCHGSGFQGTSTLCYSCHESSFNSAPNHLQQGFPHNCEMCHNTTAWNQTEFNHSSTGFVLTGSHINVNCNSCHQTGYSGTSKECFSCHESAFNSAPDHLQKGYPHACETCHNTTVWNQTNFNHNATAFQLTGSHINVDCNSCHESGFQGTSTLCYSCHESSFNSAPNHLQQGFPHNCEMCHNTTAWDQTVFDHNATAFILTGSHVNVNCNSCHQTGYSGTSKECFSCHESAYNSAQDHLQKGFPHTCETCHNTTVWNQVTFDHNSTAFVLTGAHINVNCSDCHSSGFSGTSTLCQNCHSSDYNSTDNPSHNNLNLPNNCEQCHSTNPGWAPAQFPIHDNYFVFAGAHVSIKNNCNTCHNGNYNNTPNTCYGCHQSDYNNTVNPPHQSVGFPQSCNDCHNQTNWTPAAFDHDNRFFPIYSGKHNGKWDQCSDCHTTMSNFKIFSCIDCHEHNRADTDDDHSEVNGYSYNSNECYRCHPRGDEGLIKTLRRTKFNAR